MFQKILVPLDGSRFSELAIPRALEIASRRDGSSVHLVVVVEEEPRLAGVRPDSIPPGEAIDPAKHMQAAEAYLDEVRRRIPAGNSRLEVIPSVAQDGDVAHSLLREVDDRAIDLIVMTTHGRGTLGRAWLGSVADGVVRQASRPVLLVRPDPADSELEPSEGERTEAKAAPPLRHVLVPLDGSRHAEEALSSARELARVEGARLTLASVVPPPAPAAYPYVTAPAREKQGEDTDTQSAEAQRMLEDIATRLREDGVDVGVEVMTRDDPAEAILELAEDKDVDLVAMTTRGRGGVRRWVLGSVANEVVRGAHAPVLLHCPPSSGRAGKRTEG